MQSAVSVECAMKQRGSVGVPMATQVLMVPEMVEVEEIVVTLMRSKVLLHTQ